MNVFRVVVLASLCAMTAIAADHPELDGAMKQMFNSMMNLEVMATTPERFRDSENKNAIDRDLDVLAGLKHAFPSKAKNDEPGMGAILSLFQSYVKDAHEKFDHGNAEYARHRVRTLGTFCLGCHSRVSSGRDFEDVASRVNALKLSDFQKAEFYAATRQFDKAIASYKLILDRPPKSEMDIAEYTRALAHYVRLLVRVRQDADATLQGLDALSKQKNIPAFDQSLIQGWRKDAAYWVKNKVTPGDMTGEALIRKAGFLIERAQSLHAFPSDENGDISYLRATSYLHEALDRDPKAKYRGQALYLLGVAYHALQEPFLWELDTLFFESCIRENPHTDVSRKCYKRYADAIYFGYTGSAGTFVPEDELKKLGALRGLSE